MVRHQGVVDVGDAAVLVDSVRVVSAAVIHSMNVLIK